MDSENDKVGFIYSFDMSKEIAHFKRMPEHVQISAECNAVKVNYESFVVPGDEDYLMARLLAQNGLLRGFYWAAAQTIEKYLKAFLLMNGHSVIDFRGHPIKKLFEAANKIDSSFADLSVLPHQSIQVEPSISQFLNKFTIQEFIDELQKHGNANNRYNAIGIEYNTGHLCAMDSLAFQVRRKIGAIPISKSFSKLSPDLMATFEKHNPWFQTGISLPQCQIPSVEFPIHDSVSVTTYQFLSKHKSNPAYRIALQWLGEKMKLPT